MKFKSILGAFLFIVLASFIGMLFFVQTKSFGILLTKIVSDLSQRRANARVSIKNVELSFFPPGLELNKVSVSRNAGPEKLKAEFGKLGFYLSLIEIEERRLTFGEIRILDSVIEYDFPSTDDDISEIKQEVIDKLFQLSAKAPVRIDTLIIENSHIHLNHDLLEARRLKIFKKRDKFVVRFHLANLKPSAESDLTIDEVWGDVELGRKHLEIYRLKVLHDVQTLLLKGEVKNYRLLKGSFANVKGESHLHLKDFDQELGISKTLKLQEGFADLSFNLTYENKSLTGITQATLTDFKSTLAYADKINAELRFANGVLELSKAELKRGGEYARLLNPAAVFNFSSKKILPAPLHLNLINYTLTNALRIVPELEPIRGKLTGNLTIRHDRGDFYFKPSDGFLLTDVDLVVGKQKPFRVITIKSAKLKEADVSIVDGEVRISSFAQLPRSSFEVDGFVNKKNIRFSIIDAPFNLEDLGNIANLDIKGAGPLSFDVIGGGKQVEINLKGKMKGFEVLGYKLGLADTSLSIDLADDNVIIHKLESKFGSTPISITGAVNYNNSDIALGINSSSTNYYDLSKILEPLFSKMDFLPPDLNFNAKVDANIFGKTKLKNLKVKSAIQFSDLTAFGENINAGSVNINMDNEVLFLNGFEARKGRGQIFGNFSFTLPKDHLELSYSWENLDLSSFNFSRLLHLNVDGKISGTLNGQGKTKDYELNLKTRMFETATEGHKFPDSSLEMKIFPDQLKGKMNFLGPILTSNFDISLNRSRSSDLNLKFAVPEIKPILVAVFGEHIEAENITGRLYLNLDTNFVGEFRDMNLTGHLKELSFQHPDFKFNYQSAIPDFIIKDNVIKAWKLNVSQPDVYLTSNGDGIFGQKVNLVQRVDFNSKIFEILLAPVLSSEGFVRNQMTITGKGYDYSMAFSSRAKGLDMSVQSVPFPINSLDYDIEYAEDRLQINELRSAMETGSVSLKGDVFFDDNAPDVNLKYIFDRAEIPIMGRSSLNVSGEGIILGNEYPYNLSGELVLNKALILNELNDFSSRSNTFAHVRFLPKNQESVLGRLLNLNVNVKAENSIKINNSLMDVSLRGEVRLFGNPSRPRGEGRMYVPINSSRIFFKNNEYFITSGDINFFAKKEITNPDFDIQAVTTMSTYRVYAKAYGDMERFNFDLTSDPALPRNSILSLIAFGYTDEIGSLRAEDQQSLTQMGVGSFVLDRFKISDILNKQFGVQVNVGAVFEQTEQSLLSGRSQGTGGSPGDLNRTRSATKIELKKRLDEALSLSVSSTMGGYIGSRQSMNLTYGVSRKVQLEGVYELRTAADGEEAATINNSNSIGGDVKFRWSFK